MKGKIHILTLTIGVLASLGSSLSWSRGIADSADTSLCAIAEDPGKYEGSIVSMTVLAQAALHEFDIALTDSSCPKRSIFLSAGGEFQSDAAFNRLIKALYPGYPGDDGYSNEKVKTHVKGKIERVENRELMMTYLKLIEIGSVADGAANDGPPI